MDQTSQARTSKHGPLRLFAALAVTGFAVAIVLAAVGRQARSRQHSMPGVISTIAGTGFPEFSPDLVPASQAKVCYLTGVAVLPNGNLLFTEQQHYRVRTIEDGVLKTAAGSGSIRWPDGAKTVEGHFGGDGGSAAKALLAGPTAIAVDFRGALLIADTEYQRIRMVDGRGRIMTLAGNPKVDRDQTGEYPQPGFSGDGGPARLARLNHPQGIAVGLEGEIFVADTSNHRVRRIDERGIITTVAGSGAVEDLDIIHDKFIQGGGFAGDGGQAKNAKLSYPAALAVDREGNLYIADSGNHRVRRVDRGGVITTVAGLGDVNRHVPDPTRPDRSPPQ